MKIMLKTTFALIIFAFPAVAEKLNLKQIPASAQWVIHMDFDGFKTSELGKFAMNQMDEHAGAIDALSAMLKFDPRMDLADVTALDMWMQSNPMKTAWHSFVVSSIKNTC